MNLHGETLTYIFCLSISNQNCLRMNFFLTIKFFMIKTEFGVCRRVVMCLLILLPACDRVSLYQFPTVCLLLN